jgi:dihydrofolate reductase
MAIVYFTASSLDGYIVDEAESLDWLTSRAVDADGPFGYQAFIKSVGALVMGSATYEWVVNNHPGDWMYEQPSWVLTGRPADHRRRASGADVRRGRRRPASEAGVRSGR